MAQLGLSTCSGMSKWDFYSDYRTFLEPKAGLQVDAMKIKKFLDGLKLTKYPWVNICFTGTDLSEKEMEVVKGCLLAAGYDYYEYSTRRKKIPASGLLSCLAKLE